jgi:hypothetical protein
MNGITVTASGPGSVPIITTPERPVHITIPTGPSGPTGPAGPPGTPALWESMTQAEFDALPDPDPNTLYVIVP